MAKKLTHTQFIEKLYKVNKDFREGSFSIESLYVNNRVKILVRCVYGDCLMFTNRLLYGGVPNIESAIDKSKFFINKALDILDTDYDYSKVNYINNRTKINIICKKHGEFEQIPSDHLRGHGCQKCANKVLSNKSRKNPNGWSKSIWLETAKKSKYFDSFKVYIIKCWDENEEFYKIGRTYTTVNRRFIADSVLPYKYEILKVIEGDIACIFKKEIELKRKHKKHKYVPNKKFSGMYECFSKIIW